MKTIFLLLLMGCSVYSSAQFLQDVSGRPYLSKNADEYTGSPLLFPSWVRANVFTANGKAYDNMLVNVDLFQGSPIFFSDEKTYTFSDIINQITIVDSSIKKAFKRGLLLHPDLPDVLLEVISDPLFILKKHERKLIEVPSYGGGGKSYRYAEAKIYYAMIDKKLTKINLTKENAQKIFAPKWKSVEEHAQQTDASFKTEEGWRKIAEYYLSIK